MISNKEKKKILKVLGNYYSEAVLEELHRLGVRNRNGLPHSDAMVRMVMNGSRENKEIEAAIFDAVARKKKENQKELERRSQILEQNKTGAATPA